MAGNLQGFYYLLISQIILIILVFSYSSYMVELNCPGYNQIQDISNDNPYNETNPVNALSNIWLMLGAIFSGCSGIPWWIYVVVFIPSIIAMVVYVVPFIGG